jgi:hypothetical protein
VPGANAIVTVTFDNLLNLEMLLVADDVHELGRDEVNSEEEGEVN